MFNRKKLNYFDKLWLSLDKKLLAVFFVLLLCGSLFIFTSSISVAERIELNSYHFFRNQIAYIILSIFIVFFMILTGDFINIKLIFIGFLICLAMLFCVHLFGFSTKGAKRWIYIFGCSIQPSEIIKPFLIMINAYLLGKFDEKQDFKKIIISSIPFLIVACFLYLQPDIGILFLLSITTLTQIFLSKIKFRNILVLFYFLLVLAVISYYSLSHVKNRINIYIKGLKDNSNVSYQVASGLQAYSNAGYLGKGLFEGTEKNFIPDAHTDFIFPCIAEEFGFSIVLILVSIYLYFALRIVLKANLVRKNIFKYLSLWGLALLVIFQAFINICVTLNLLPTKGMTLPFLSYGGSSLISVSIIFGFILIFTKKDYTFESGDILEIKCLQ